MRKKINRFMMVVGFACLMGSTQVLPVLAEETFSYADVSELEFCFSSGVGGWATYLWIDEDGSFEGSYHDTDMGTTGEGYPNGTVYACDFFGKFSVLEKVDEYTYSTEIESIELKETPGTTEILDGVQYVYSEPYGLNDSKEVLFYLPGTPLDELPEEFLSWVGYYHSDDGYHNLDDKEETELPFVGLYNENAEEGFSSYEKRDISVEEPLSAMDMELREIEEKAAELEAQLDSGFLAQLELNRVSGELYMLWDDELNSIWGRLKKLLPKDEMEQLTSEELEWIKEKEAAVAAAGAEMEGGSMQPLLENSEAARLTRIRVYELAEYME